MEVEWEIGRLCPRARIGILLARRSLFENLVLENLLLEATREL